jgi:hypothetical protein
MRRIFLSGGETSRGLRVQHLTHLGPTPILQGAINAPNTVQVCQKLPYDPHLSHHPCPQRQLTTNVPDAVRICQLCRKLPYDPHLYPRLGLQRWLMVNLSLEWIYLLHLQLYGSTTLTLPGLLSLPGIALFPRVLMPPYYTAEVVAADTVNALVAHHLHPALSTQLH